MIIVPKKLDRVEILAADHEKVFLKQWFRNRETGEEYDYSLLSSKSGRRPSIVMPLTKNFEVIVTKQYRHGADEIVYEFAGGMPKDDYEKPEDVARRELGEEHGYSLEKLISLNRYTFFDPATYTIPFYPFLALGCTENGKGQQLDETEKIETCIFELQTWYTMIKSGTVCDGKTIATMLLGLMALNATIVMPELGIAFS